MTSNPSSLNSLLTQTTLTFTNPQVETLLAHVGDLNPEIRDDLVYTLLARGLDENGLTPLQKQLISQRLIQKRWLFREINQPQNDTVFLRTFTALLTAEVLDSDRKSPWLSDANRQQFFQDALHYLSQEHDERGLVLHKGWAHGIAHGSDLLGAACRHPQFTQGQTKQALSVLQQVLLRQTRVFTFDEEPRLAHPLIFAQQHGTLTEPALTTWLMDTNTQLWQNFSFDDAVADARLHNWLSFCHHLYFWLPNDSPNRQVITDLSVQYYRKYGYLRH